MSLQAYFDHLAGARSTFQRQASDTIDFEFVGVPVEHVVLGDDSMTRAARVPRGKVADSTTAQVSGIKQQRRAGGGHCESVKTPGGASSPATFAPTARPAGNGFLLGLKRIFGAHRPRRESARGRPDFPSGEVLHRVGQLEQTP